jgi:endonuclease/exonuclease/phosphatase (EEP) superfamily protein YafD
MRRKLAVLVWASLAGLSACSRDGRTVRSAEPGTATLEVMTYNVNYGLEGDPEAVELIRRQSSDLVLLQETTPGWEKSLRTELAGAYPHMDFHHCCGAGGMAVLSKHPIGANEILEPPDGGWFPAWKLEIDSPLGRLQVLNVHLRPQLSERGNVVSGYFTTPRVRFSEMERYYERLDQDLPTLVVGDFNESSRGLAVGYLERRGFKSALGEFGGDNTWRWPTSVGTVRAELDHIVYAPPLEPLEVKVLAAGQSDHLPLVARFALRSESR